MNQEQHPLEFEVPEWLEQIEGLLESLNEGVIISDDCHRILFVNSCFEEMIGQPAADLVGQLSSHFYSPEEYAFILKQIDLSAATGRNRFEFVLPLKDGSRMPVIVSSRRLEDPDGRDFAIVTFTDISDQKSAEEQLRDANSRLQDRQREMDEDLALAARVQQSLAPKSIVWGGLRVDTYYHPVRTIGGDFGVVSPLDGEHLNLLVCDVSGHGIGSALVANRIYTETATQLRHGVALADMLQQLNRFVLQSIGGSVFFFTLAAARIERNGRRMVFAGAGHPPGMVVRPGRSPSYSNPAAWCWARCRKRWTSRVRSRLRWSLVTASCSIPTASLMCSTHKGKCWVFLECKSSCARLPCCLFMR